MTSLPHEAILKQTQRWDGKTYEFWVVGDTKGLPEEVKQLVFYICQARYQFTELKLMHDGVEDYFTAKKPKPNPEHSVEEFMEAKREAKRDAKQPHRPGLRQKRKRGKRRSK